MTNPTVKKQVGILFLTVFIYLVGFGMIIPIIPTWARELQATSFEVGILMSLYSFFQFLFAPFWGALSDRRGRKFVILFCLLGEAFSYVIFALGSGLPQLFLARALAGVFGGSISTVTAALSDVTPPEKRSASMGLIGAAFGLGFIIGPGLGGVLSYYGGVKLAGFTVAGICLLTAIFGVFFLQETLKNKKPKEEKKKESRLALLRSRLRQPGLKSVLTMQFFASMAMSMMEATLILLMADRFSWGLREVNFGFVSIGLTSAFMQGFVVRKVLPRIGEANAVRFSMLSMGLGLALIPWMQTVPLVGVALLLFVVGNSFANPSLLGSVSLLSSPQEQGVNLGVAQSLSALGRICGPALGGASYQISAYLSFTLSGLWAFAGALLAHIDRRSLPGVAKSTEAKKS